MAIFFILSFASYIMAFVCLIIGILHLIDKDIEQGKSMLIKFLVLFIIGLGAFTVGFYNSYKI